VPAGPPRPRARHGAEEGADHAVGEEGLDDGAGAWEREGEVAAALVVVARGDDLHTLRGALLLEERH
jgi:hypothetical protein